MPSFTNVFCNGRRTRRLEIMFKFVSFKGLFGTHQKVAECFSLACDVKTSRLVLLAQII